MRYHYKRNSFIGSRTDIYYCKHPMYNKCTLIKIGSKGLAIVQKRFNPKTKYTWWSEIDGDILYDIWNHPGIKAYIESKGREADANGLYPTINVRKVMWALRIKPIPRQIFEDDF